MKKLKFTTKLQVLVGVALLIGALTAAFLLVRLSAIAGTYDRLVNGPVRVQLAAAEAQQAFDEQVQEWENLLVRGRTPESLQKYTDSYHARRAATEDRLAALAERAEGTAVEATVAELRDKYATFTELHDAALQYRIDKGISDAAVLDGMVRGWDIPVGDLMQQTVSTMQGVVDSDNAATLAAVGRERTIIVVGILVVFPALLVGMGLVTRRMLRPVVDVSTAATRLAAGDLDQQIEVRSEDEVGRLAAAFGDLVTYLQSVAAANDALSRGDTSQRVRPRSETDTLGHAAERMVETIDALLVQVRDLSARTAAGDLAARLDAAKFTGGYADFASGINLTLESVVRPLEEAATVLGRVAGHDLTTRMTGEYVGDFARLQRALNMALDNLESSLRMVASASGQVTEAASQIASGSQSLASSTSEQSSSLQDATSHVEATAELAGRNSEDVSAMHAVAETARTEVVGGTASLERLTDAIEAIVTASEQARSVVQTVSQISQQTGMLSLNAAVEAARAGEAGAGFAVVAEEVRSLATRASDATKNIQEIIEQSADRARAGAEAHQDVRGRFEGIDRNVRDVAELAVRVAEASTEQASGMGRAASAIGGMQAAVSDTAAFAEESAAVAEEMTAQAHEMQNLVSKFHLGEDAGQGERPVAFAEAAATTPPCDADLEGLEDFDDF